MRIGLVCPYDLGRFGGVQDLVTGLAGWLREAGHEAVVVGPGVNGGAGMRGVGRAVTVPFNGSAAPVAVGPAVGRRVLEAVRECEVVHVHEPLVPMVSLAARHAGTPLVGTFHADPSPAIRRTYRATAPAVRRILRPYDVITAVSPVAAAAARSFGPVRLVPNGVDIAEFDPAPGEPHRVAFLGRDDPRKGLDVLLEAWPRVRERVPDAELVVASAGRRGDTPGIRFIGGVGPDERRRLLAGASVYCAPNLGGESFGIVLVQAMASRCAIVASALPAFAHVLGDAGVLVKPGDAEGLAQALVGLLEDGRRREELQERAVMRVGRFDRTAVTAGYLDAYTDALARSSERRHA